MQLRGRYRDFVSFSFYAFIPIHGSTDAPCARVVVSRKTRRNWFNLYFARTISDIRAETIKLHSVPQLSRVHCFHRPFYTSRGRRRTVRRRRLLFVFGRPTPRYYSVLYTRSHLIDCWISTLTEITARVDVPTPTSAFRIIYSPCMRTHIPILRIFIRTYECVCVCVYIHIHLSAHTAAVVEIEIQLSAVPVITWWNVGILFTSSSERCPDRYLICPDRNGFQRVVVCALVRTRSDHVYGELKRAHTSDFVFFSLPISWFCHASDNPIIIITIPCMLRRPVIFLRDLWLLI